MREKKALRGRIAPGAFSGERVFEITLADGETYRGVAPVHYCWDAAGRPFGLDEPAAPIPGTVACRRLETIDGQSVLAIPDGEVVRVDEDSIVDRPRGVTVDVPV
jgi:hypothetical protein